MKLSQKGEYGLLALLELAGQYGTGPVQSAAIAAAREIPAQYLQQILLSLRRAGLVRSGRGPRGGHVLARPPQQVTLLDAVRALEGATAPAACAVRESAPGCPQRGHCVLAGVWRQVDEATQDVLGAVTLAELARRERECDATPMYYI